MSADLRIVASDGVQIPALRLAASQDTPIPITPMESYHFANVSGRLVILHNCKPITATQAMAQLLSAIKTLLVPAVALELGGKSRPQRLPGDMGGIEFHDGHPYAVQPRQPTSAETDGDCG